MNVIGSEAKILRKSGHPFQNDIEPGNLENLDYLDTDAYSTYSNPAHPTSNNIR